MPQGLDNLKHIVVLMMENRSFDHMLGGLKKKFPKINGLTGNESNPDSAGNMVQVSATADYRGQLSHDPDHHFPGRGCADLWRRAVLAWARSQHAGLCEKLWDARPECAGFACDHEIFFARANSGFNHAGD